MSRACPGQAEKIFDNFIKMAGEAGSPVELFYKINKYLLRWCEYEGKIV